MQQLFQIINKIFLHFHDQIFPHSTFCFNSFLRSVVRGRTLCMRAQTFSRGGCNEIGVTCALSIGFAYPKMFSNWKAGSSLQMLSCLREAFWEAFTEAAVGYKYWRIKSTLTESITFCRTELKQNVKAARNLFALKQRKETNAIRQVRQPHHSSVFFKSW